MIISINYLSADQEEEGQRWPRCEDRQTHAAEIAATRADTEAAGKAAGAIGGGRS